MAKLVFNVREAKGFKVIGFEIPGGITTPEEVSASIAENANIFVGGKVLINGRGPVWAFAKMIHQAHATEVVATFDPRGGVDGSACYVVASAHTEEFAGVERISDPEA